MALSIKSDEADRLARELAAETGETLTEAVETALRERLDREHANRAASMRTRLKRLAADGRTVFVSSHLMNEMAVTADHLIVIGQGRLHADCPAAEFIGRNSKPQVLVKTSGAAQLTQLVTSEGAQVRRSGTDVLTVTGVPAPRIAELAAAARVVVYELTPQRASLEEAFLSLTGSTIRDESSASADQMRQFAQLWRGKR